MSGLSKQIVYLRDFKEEADKLEQSFGYTNLFKIGHDKLDRYFGGGFGRQDGYEIVLLYGDTGIGKSTIALNFLAQAITEQKKVGLAILEDDMADARLRLKRILGPETLAKVDKWDNVVCIPKDALMRSWKLSDLLDYLEDWFVDQNVELVLVDHLQFAFEGAESVKGENEYASQRVFMQKLNHMMKRVKKTIILISHVNKGNATGMGKIVGSGAIAQACTKVIEIEDVPTMGQIRLTLHKTRFTRKPGFPYYMQMNGMKLEPADIETIEEM